MEAEVDMSPYDPLKVARLRSAIKSDPARLRFAMHVQRLCPTHVWPHWIYAQLAEEPTERAYHLAALIKVADEQLDSEQAGTAMRKRDKLEDEITRKAMRSYSEWLADEGFPSKAASIVAKLLKMDPEDELGVMDMAKSKGVIPAYALDQVCGITM